MIVRQQKCLIIIIFLRNALHVMVNEIYSLSVFEGKFTSVAALPHLPDPDRTHFMWGFSKVGRHS